MSNPNGGLITETNAQYYAGQQSFKGTGVADSLFTCTFNTNLVLTIPGVSNTNFSVTVNGAVVTNYTFTLDVKNAINLTLLGAGLP